VNAGPWAVTTVVSDNEWVENGYVLEHRDTGDIVVIDPGGSPAQYMSLLENRAAHICAILLTHGHHDHVGAVAALSEASGVPCTIHRGDARVLRQAAMYGMRLGGRVIATPRNVAYFESNAIVVSGESIRVLETPGHTAGSVVFTAGDTMFTGDTLLLEKVGRTDLPGGDGARLRESIGAILSATDNAALLAGHGTPWTLSEAREWWAGVRDAPPSHVTLVP
jgi:glyoxylase-like metal-dependent hydrolase (beta-lactamase superfamily II)